MKYSISILLATTLTFSLCINANAETKSIMGSGPTRGTLDVSLRNEVNASVGRTLDWLAANQKENGSWSNEKYPALTALALRPFILSNRPEDKKVIDKGISFIKSCVNKDGGIYHKVPMVKGGGLSNYNTAICMITLHASKRPDLIKIIQNARKFIADGQHLGGDEYHGGFGYDKSTKRAYTDLLNTYHSVKAMRITQDVEDLRPASEKRVDIDWDASIKFITAIQNKEDAGEADANGFFYKPGQSKAGTTTNSTGKIVFRSYGSMTYTGLLSLMYSNVSRDDPRIMSAFHWSARHWSLEENPGMGKQGMYFFYNILTKSLDAFGQDLVPRPDNKNIDWRREVASKILELQKTDKNGHGYWINENSRFWESDPVLTTAYSVLALQTL
ncbi:hypothetical protein BVX94_00965 [bacterium B17]|nr:hypothetical protein BVX94_00965 [bacterium B17]